MGAPPPLLIAYSCAGWGSVALGDTVTVDVTVTDPAGIAYDGAYVFATLQNPAKPPTTPTGWSRWDRALSVER